LTGPAPSPTWTSTMPDRCRRGRAETHEEQARMQGGPSLMTGASGGRAERSKDASRGRRQARVGALGSRRRCSAQLSICAPFGPTLMAVPRAQAGRGTPQRRRLPVVRGAERTSSGSRASAFAGGFFSTCYITGAQCPPTFTDCPSCPSPSRSRRRRRSPAARRWCCAPPLLRSSTTVLHSQTCPSSPT
jgi:hypothetical protein